MSTVLRYQTPEDYRAARTQVFPSAYSFQWAVRKWRRQLVAAGALVKPMGRTLVDPEKFDQVMADEGRKNAALTLA
jgi:hypothetical protein